MTPRANVIQLLYGCVLSLGPIRLEVSPLQAFQLSLMFDGRRYHTQVGSDLTHKH